MIPNYTQIIQRMPQELQAPVQDLVDALRLEQRQRAAARREASDELKYALAELARAQNRSEGRLDRLEAAVAELVEAQKRTEQQVRELAEAQKRTEQQVRELAEAQKRTEQQVRELVEAQKRSEARLDRLEVAVTELAEAQKRTEIVIQKILNQLGKHTGQLLEMEYRDKAYSIFGTLLRRAKVVSLETLEPVLEQHLTAAEMISLLPLDLLVRGQARLAEIPGDIYLAIEISAVIDINDVERAFQRAALLRKGGFPAIATVAGERVTAGAQAGALTRNVLIVENSNAQNWTQALATLQP